MTTLLKKAIAEAERLTAEDQDAIGARLLAEIEDERGWDVRFRATTDDQWDRLAAEARRDIAAGPTFTLDEVFQAGDESR